MKLNIVGSRGHWGYIFESIKEIPDVELSAVAIAGNDSIEPVIERANQIGIYPQIYDDYLAMLEQQKPDIVCINGPFEKHAEYSIECLNRNIHVFCEKPIALTLDDLAKVEQAYQNSSAKIFSMIGIRYEAPFQTALNLVKEGAIGKVKLISTRKSYKLGRRPEHFKHRQSYGGTISWVGSHAFDWIMAFSDCYDIQKVFAVDSREDNFCNGELEIVAQCQLVMTNGVFGQISIDYLRPATASTHGDDQVRVAGTLGVIEVRHGKVCLINQLGETEILPVAKRSIFSDIVLDCLGKRKAMTSPEETIKLTRGCLEAQNFADLMR